MAWNRQSSVVLPQASQIPWMFGFCLFWTSLAFGEAGSIRGQLADEEGQAVSVGNAVVFVCDAKSGMPIVAKSKKPFELGERIEGFKDFWHVLTTETGGFEFKEVPIGKYRLVAQTWPGIKGVPEFKDKPPTTVILHGTAEGVEVKANEATMANPKKLGKGILKIINDPEEEHAFLLISRNPRLGEGVLGPAAWGPEFLSGIIGVTQMEEPYVTLTGLPGGKEIHVGLFNYDNNPGVGGASYVVGKEQEVRLEIYATWSNGKHDPPARLLKLTQHLEKKNLSAAKLLGLPGKERDHDEALRKMLREKADQKIEVEGVGTFRLADILAADTYKELRKHHRARKQR